MSADARISELQLQLPEAPKPGGIYTPAVQVGNMLYVSGHGPVQLDGTLITGRVGQDLTEEEGRQAARQVGLTILATLMAQLGSLDKIEARGESLGHGQRRPGFRTPSFGDQRIQPTDGGCVRRSGPRCPQCRRHGIAAGQHPRGSGSDFPTERLILGPQKEASPWLTLRNPAPFRFTWGREVMMSSS